ncbi:type II toxin-antitoxin system VapC family toxin [soil metagenome]
MIALDTNLLVYAHKSGSPFHRASLEAIRPLVEAAMPWALPWQVVHEFIAVVTHPRIYRPASTVREAFGFLDLLFASPSIHLLSESHGYLELLHRVVRQSHAIGAQIHDARLAALCLHHGVSELWTADRDFRAFPQLRTRNPLA